MPVGFYRVVPIGDAVRDWVDGPITSECPERGWWPGAGDVSEGEGVRWADFLGQGVG